MKLANWINFVKIEMLLDDGLAEQLHQIKHKPIGFKFLPQKSKTNKNTNSQRCLWYNIVMRVVLKYVFFFFLVIVIISSLIRVGFH